MTFVYGELVQKLREHVWERLTTCGLVRLEPWFIIGDFNEITGRKNKVMVRCRLDRALANEDWLALFPCSYTEYLGMVGSDHRPIMAFLEDKVSRRRGQFRRTLPMERRRLAKSREHWKKFKRMTIELKKIF
ncbi:hypothetical protein N665_0018s0013 [Sinapis alba]|nr:hypothetical protein N665_0018s0013 [Sinapis alba]